MSPACHSPTQPSLPVQAAYIYEQQLLLHGGQTSFCTERVITAAQNPTHFIQDLREQICCYRKLNQSQMELLTTALVIVLLTTASAKPIGRRRHYDADITENDRLQGLSGRNYWWYQSSSPEDSSSDSDQSLDSRESSQSSESQSSESQSSESQSSEESSSEEVLITNQTTPVMTTTTKTTITTGEGSALTPEPETMGTDEPTVTPPPETTTTPVATSPSNVTNCVTVEIPTAAPITENRGDN
ncbi:secretory calcium-binding phosphoprotein 8 [Dicentrarchus labrax]|uniref:secretory calcium-binding phosphoprotein 8 n=1 Tax=Dicentrarchus labrax TaxID=13489 RepID=UPI0021F686F1|nr:secretory calcium-binding phosphoprotein 8 [Dicentrarchus labrax]